MIVALIIIGLAFVWLLYESNWMRVRLPVGAITQARTMTVSEWLDACHIPPSYRLGYEPEYPYPITNFEPSTQPVRLYKVQSGSAIYITRTKPKPNNGHYIDRDALKLSACIAKPICGWTWLLRRSHPPVIHEFTVIAHGCTSHVRLNPDAHKGRIIQEVSRATLRKMPKRRKGVKAS